MNVFSKIRQYAKDYDRWAQSNPSHATLSHEWHTCTNCGTEFDGRFCPQCGLKHNLSRLTLRNLVLNFLDMWGFGSRPMFNTLKQLFTRPGYMIRDYLTGHQPLYFPPFKMLAVFVVIYVTVAWLLNIDLNSVFKTFASMDVNRLSDRGRFILTQVHIIEHWFTEHLLFAAILFQCFGVLSTAIAFRKCETKWNLVELFFAHIYMAVVAFSFDVLAMLTTGNIIGKTSYGFLFTIPSMIFIWLTLAQLYNLKFLKSLVRCISKLMWHIFLLTTLTVVLVIIITLT